MFKKISLFLLILFYGLHLNATIKQNSLIYETSPYLLQHATNPIDWFPWGDEAFRKAKQENKLIFLSIGYSTCHWCHVMAEESFKNSQIAKLFNKHFINIKVDREEFPDVDNYYMQSVIKMTGSGGWPLNLFLTADAKPLLGGSYFTSKKLIHMATNLSQIWEKAPDKLLANALSLDRMLKEELAIKPAPINLVNEDIDEAVSTIEKLFDKEYGGFGDRTKFPHESYLLLLLEKQLLTHDSKRQIIIDKTLLAMANGGIYDHLGGGFHRYSTDRKWRVPHFEKMLYNQALLAKIYAKAYNLTGNVLYKKISQNTLNYVLETLQSPEGTFYSAMDADKNGQEGFYYLWDEKELENLPDVKEIYHIDSTYELNSKNILYLSQNIESSRLHKVNKSLLEIRTKRETPAIDHKIITSWNAMMIDSLVVASKSFHKDTYLQSALVCAETIWEKSRNKDGKLYRVTPSKDKTIPAVQEDYAYLAKSYISLYDVTNDSIWLKRAVQLTQDMNIEFWDKENGGYFISNSSLLLNQHSKQTKDTEIPSGNAIALEVLSLLYYRTGEEKYQSLAQVLLSTFSQNMLKYMNKYAYMFLSASKLINTQVQDIQYVSKGNIKIESRFQDSSTFVIKIVMKDGWYINSNKPRKNYLIPTSITLNSKKWVIKSIRFPKEKLKYLSYSKVPLSLFEGTIEILINMKEINKPDLRKSFINLNFQACNDKYCQANQELIIRINNNDIITK